MEEKTDVWTETDSRDFLDLAEVGVPGRQEQIEMLLWLVPAAQGEDFRAVELACGEGLLAERLLDRFPRLQLTAFDGSDLMLEAARKRLSRLSDRVELRKFELESATWVAGIQGTLRCALSSLAIHHLTDEDKRSLYKRFAERLEASGALLVADVVLPDNPLVRRAVVDGWHRIARQQSQALTGSLDTYQRLAKEGWAPPETDKPEPGEMPARLYDHLAWLKEAGFEDVDCFWMRGGIAIYGGYR
ncbi:MAG TPA: methyltransferase domain-containing protein [Dehalococcoidia bacterium]|jgi:ubiquinone/menaquinone biosynthesis C-methylase UbiE|nr:methyltransferase domain-containing protein [Dehalococcoidia bacterium]